MRKLLLILSLICFYIAANAQSKIDVLFYKFRIELNDNNDTIKGSAVISFLVTAPVVNIIFDLADSKTNGKGMTVSSVTFPFRNTLSPLIEHTKNKLILTPGYGYKKGDTAEVIINYKGIPADGLIISKNQFGNRTFFADNWPNRAHNWIPCVDDPADKASVEFIVTAPSHYQVISNGVRIEETNLPGNKKLTHYKEEVPLPTKVMVIGAADFAINNIGDINCIAVSSWVFPENKKEGFYDYAIAKDILAFYINYIGPYAYKKLASVQSKTMFGGMENASAIFYAEASVTGQRLEERLIAHEIVHQWFGNMATEKSFAHFWLSEGFATYLTHVYLESKYGTDSLNVRMKEDRYEVIDFVKTNRRPVVDSTPDYMRLLGPNSYQKGGWVLHMLRRELGDSVFKKSIRLYYATYTGKNADTKDLQKIFEKVSGKDLEQFFQQWLHTGENPSLDIKWNYDQKKKQLIVNVNQRQNNEFRFPLDIAFKSKAGKTVVQKLFIDKRGKTFIFPVTEKPLAVIADPNTSLLYEGTVQEMR